MEKERINSISHCLKSVFLHGDGEMVLFLIEDSTYILSLFCYEEFHLRD